VQQTQISNLVTNANANTAAYLASGGDATITNLQNSIVYIQGTLSGLPGQSLATQASVDAANISIAGANIAWQENAASQLSQITGANVNISALQANLGGYYIWANANVAGLSASITTANTAMKAYVDANTLSQAASINSLNSAQTTISGQIGTLQSNAVSQQSAITTLQSQVNGPVFIATQTTGQSLSTIGSITQLPLIFNSIERASPYGLYNSTTGIFTPNVAGYYQVSVGCAATTANASANLSTFYYATLLYKNTDAVASGSLDRPQVISGLNAIILASSQVSREIYLNGTTDYIRANIGYYNGSSGSGWNTNIPSYTIVPNYFQAVWVRGT
jgi:hypothetical protein